MLKSMNVEKDLNVVVEPNNTKTTFFQPKVSPIHQGTWPGSPFMSNQKTNVSHLGILSSFKSIFCVILDLRTDFIYTLINLRGESQFHLMKDSVVKPN